MKGSVDILRLAKAAAKLDKQGATAGIADCSDGVQIARGAFEGAFEVNHVQPLGALGKELARGFSRIVGVDGLLVQLALAQADDLAGVKVDCGDHEHSTTSLLKLERNLRPAFWLFSGWNWVA